MPWPLTISETPNAASPEQQRVGDDFVIGVLPLISRPCRAAPERSSVSVLPEGKKETARWLEERESSGRLLTKSCFAG